MLGIWNAGDEFNELVEKHVSAALRLYTNPETEDVFWYLGDDGTIRLQMVDDIEAVLPSVAEVAQEWIVDYLVSRATGKIVDLADYPQVLALKADLERALALIESVLPPPGEELRARR